MGVANKAWKYSDGVVVNSFGIFCNSSNNVNDKEKLKVQDQQQNWRLWFWPSNASTAASARRPKISWSVKVCGVMLFAVGLISLFTGHLASDLEWYSQRFGKRFPYHKELVIDCHYDLHFLHFYLFLFPFFFLGC